MKLKIQCAKVFEPLNQPDKRYYGAYGGRGSAKSNFFAEKLVIRNLSEPGLRAVCTRETQKSIRFSSRQLIVDKINHFQSMGVDVSGFELQEQFIRTPGDGLIIFQGLQEHTADSIKSLEGFDIAWIEEAQAISVRSWRLLRPTIRKPGSQIWASWNPEKATDPVDKFFRSGKSKVRMACVEANWRDNPWFPPTLKEERETDLESLDSSEYAHIWEGAYLLISDAIIFKNKVLFEQEISPPEDARLFFGMDFGFARDPAMIVRAWIEDDYLCVDYAEGGPGIEMDELPSLLKKVPGVEEWPIKADGSRPETISYLSRRGFRISAAKKWAGSIQDGISHLKSYKGIKVHKRAYKIANEFRLYSYVVDKRTDDILPKIVDKNNHAIDALRYALDGIITSSIYLGERAEDDADSFWEDENVGAFDPW